MWCDIDCGVDRFQLAFDKPRKEKVETSKRGVGYIHARVDEDRSTQYPGSPMLNIGISINIFNVSPPKSSFVNREFPPAFPQHLA